MPTHAERPADARLEMPRPEPDRLRPGLDLLQSRDLGGLGLDDRADQFRGFGVLAFSVVLFGHGVGALVVDDHQLDEQPGEVGAVSGLEFATGSSSGTPTPRPLRGPP